MDTSRYICSSTRCPVSGTNLYVHLEGPWRYGDFICPKPRSDLLNSCLLSSVMLHTETRDKSNRVSVKIRPAEYRARARARTNMTWQIRSFARPSAFSARINIAEYLPADIFQGFLDKFRAYPPVRVRLFRFSRYRAFAICGSVISAHGVQTICECDGDGKAATERREKREKKMKCR